MGFNTLGALALTASLAAASRDASPFFSGTSPFYLFSSSSLQTSQLEGKQIAINEDIQSTISQTLSSCPSDTYIVVKQPGVDASDFQQDGAVPHLQKWFAEGGERTVSSAAVAQVQGQVDADDVSGMLAKSCKAREMKVDASSGAITIDDVHPRVITVDFSSLPWNEERTSTLAAHDSFLNEILSTLKASDSYTVIYTTTPSSEAELSDMPHPQLTYEMEDTFQGAMHTDLKRDLSSREGNSTLDSNLPLFEKYQFLSPGIFMGGIVFLFFFIILYVGISAVSSVQVSYFAFSKEMGPSAQKKQ